MIQAVSLHGKRHTNYFRAWQAIFKLPRHLRSRNNLRKHLTVWPHINYEDSLVMKLRGKVKDSNEIGMHFFYDSTAGTADILANSGIM